MLQPEIFYDAVDYQEEFQLSEKPKAYLSCGYGGGKTYALVMKMLELCSVNAGLPGGIVAPSLTEFRRDVLPTVEQICAENNIPFHFHKTHYYFTFPATKSKVYVFHAEDHGRSIRGPNLAFMCINEITMISKATFMAAIGRVRLKTAPRLQVVMSGTPEGFNWAYEYFIEHQRDDTELIFGDMRKNTHVHESYAQMLIESYDEKLVEQYVQGKFVNLTGNRAAYSFDRHKHTHAEVEKDPLYETWVSMDFNVDPMSGVLWNRLPGIKRGNEGFHEPIWMKGDLARRNVWLAAYDEIKIHGSNTYEFCEVLKTKVTKDDNVVIFPDPAGKARSTKTRGKTDIDILKMCGFGDIRFKARIQSVRDCLNSLNNLFSKNRIVINSKRCKSFIADLEQCIIKKGTFEIDKSNADRTHWLDGAKNMAQYEFPIVRPNVKHYNQVFR